MPKLIRTGWSLILSLCLLSFPAHANKLVSLSTGLNSPLGGAPVSELGGGFKLMGGIGGKFSKSPWALYVYSQVGYNRLHQEGEGALKSLVLTAATAAAGFSSASFSCWCGG